MAAERNKRKYEVAAGGDLTPDQRAAALRLVLSDNGDSVAAQQAGEVLASELAGDISLAGLIAVLADHQPIAAAWALVQPGKTALLWPARWNAAELGPEAEETSTTMADRLLDVTLNYLGTSNVRVVQSALTEASGEDAARLVARGFFHGADLLYLTCSTEQFPVERPETPLQLESFTPTDEQRMAHLIDRTYEGTCDCPRLNGVRLPADVLAGFRATGVFSPERWLFATEAGRDLGCLLLADHPTHDQWELVYMGVTPEARGRGLGLALTRQAQWLTRQSGRPRLVLAVDATNGPGLATYAAAGFEAWDRRSAFLKVYSQV